MPIVGKATGFDYTGKWGIDVGTGQPIQMGSRPPSEADWELMSPQEKAAFGLPDWNTYQSFQHAYETRSQAGGDIYQEKQRAAQILLQGHPQTWEQAKNLLLQNGFDPSSTASGPLFKELETLWNGGQFQAGGHGATVGAPGTGMDAIAAWLPGLGLGMAMQDWFAKGTSSQEGFDPGTQTWWNRAPDGSIHYLDSLGNPLSGPPPGFQMTGGTSSGGAGGGGGMGSLAGLLGGGNVDNELAQQAHLDTLMQQFEYEKAAREYGQAIPLENYMTDLYGDIMGVNFDKPQFSLQNYFQQGMRGVGQSFPPPGTPAQPLPQNPKGTKYPTIPDAPNGSNQAPGVPPTTSKDEEQPINDTYDSGMVNGMGGGLGVSKMPPLNAEPGVPLPPAGNENGQVSTNLPAPPQRGFEVGQDPLASLAGLFGGGGGSAGMMPQVPFPTIEGNGYNLKTGNAMDLADQTTWGLLAPEVNREVEDMDNLMKRYDTETPMGGERGMAHSEMLRDLGGKIGGIRQNLLRDAMSGISGLAGAKKGYAPGNYSGSGQAMASNALTARGQDLQNSQFGQDLAFQRKSAGATLKANRQAQSNSLLTGLMSTLGTLGSAAITHSDRRVKANIEPSERGLAELAQLPVYEWDYLPEYGGLHSAGVMAQDLEKVMPEAVGSVGGVKTVNTAHLLAATINAVKELKAQLDKHKVGRRS